MWQQVMFVCSFGSGVCCPHVVLVVACGLFACQYISLALLAFNESNYSLKEKKKIPGVEDGARNSVTHRTVGRCLV